MVWLKTFINACYNSAVVSFLCSHIVFDNGLGLVDLPSLYNKSRSLQR